MVTPNATLCCRCLQADIYSERKQKSFKVVSAQDNSYFTRVHMQNSREVFIGFSSCSTSPSNMFVRQKKVLPRIYIRNKLQELRTMMLFCSQYPGRENKILGSCEACIINLKREL
ncbi:hypothetical protein AMECASPLE_005653 [Ameca splendens]|uniref:Uncharacterized protein n=1 Tax=Ameca splendens TaxID=208324 RepID=A0ABV0XZ32_9TELE